MKNLVLLSSICIVLLSSCATVYRTNMTATPLFTEKGQVSLEGAASRDGANFSAAASVSNNLAIMVNGQFNKNARRPNAFDSNPAKGSYGEIAVGYFKKIKENLLFETYAGVGDGHLSDIVEFSETQKPESLKYSKVFLQPNIAAIGKNINFTFTPRIAYISGRYSGNNLILDPTTPDVSVTQVNKSISFFSFEPTSTLSFGNEYLKGFVQSGININKRSDITSLYNVGCGIQVRLAKKKK